MKVFVYASLVSSGFASFADMEAQFNQLQQYSNGTTRGFSSSFLNDVEDYGCWCSFNENHGGKGQAVDQLDATCKSLSNAYECAVMDSEEVGDSCTPYSVVYFSPPIFAIDDTESLVIQCEGLNAAMSPCAIRACIIENQFVLDSFEALQNGGVIPEYQRSNGFDPKNDCPVSPGLGEVERSCCGHYPFRRPFKSGGGERACCGMRTFNPNVLTCCTDLVPRISC